MPSLADLPLEILTGIARCLGSAYLRSNANNLLLFKKWWQVAQRLAYEDLTLNLTNIEGFLRAPEYIQTAVQSSARSLEIKEVESNNVPYEDHELVLFAVGAPTPPPSDGPPRRLQWGLLTESLTTFAPHIRHMPHLRSFSLQLIAFDHPSYEQQLAAFIAISSLFANLPSRLSSLTLDVSGAPAAFEVDDFLGDRHFCDLFRDLSIAGQLRHLRIRTRNICDRVLDNISSGGYDHLERLNIHLSLGEDELPRLCKIFYSRSCFVFPRDHNVLRSSLVDAAKRVVANPTDLKTLQIMEHQITNGSLVSTDVVSDRHVRMEPGVRWKDAAQLGDNDMSDIESHGHSENSSSSTWSNEEPPFVDLNAEGDAI